MDRTIDTDIFYWEMIVVQIEDRTKTQIFTAFQTTSTSKRSMIAYIALNQVTPQMIHFVRTLQK